MFELGQVESGKRTRGERRRKHNCVVLCSGVCRSGEHSAETLHFIKCNEAMTNYNIRYECNEATMVMQRLYIILYTYECNEAKYKMSVYKNV